MNAGVLVIGYGNGLRGDDGLGPEVVDALRAEPRLAGATLLSRHQLTPDLVVDIAAAGFVVLIDATVEVAPGVVCVTPLAAVRGAGTAWSHHLDPVTLVGLAAELYGHVPDVVVVSVGIAATEPGEPLSAPVATAVPRVVDIVADLAQARSRVASHA